MPRRFQFSLRALLVAMLVVAAFFGGIHFERERRRLAAEAAAKREDAVRVYPLFGPARLITLPNGTKTLQQVSEQPQEWVHPKK
ncbi:MAG TPA: hypothetical protein VNH11_00835 [Pirellulales bacterium]|nr:hypothetical protein [Pirellulales bacterium]